MKGLRKHIDRLNSLDLISLGLKIGQILRQGRGITGNVDQSPGSDLKDVLNRLVIKTGPGRIDDDQIN